jgi:hypothetical protein
LTNWNQSVDDLLQGSSNAQHSRTRERSLALYMIASGQSNATLWAKPNLPTFGRQRNA